MAAVEDSADLAEEAQAAVALADLGKILVR
jgi:hypothetical protein